VDLSQPKPYSTAKNPRGYWLSEKLDGVRAVWTGERLLSRGGFEIVAPAWWLAGLPSGACLDGELWAGRGNFQRVLSIAGRKDFGGDWQTMRFMAFDAPLVGGIFSARFAALADLPRGEVWSVVPQTECDGREHMAAELARVVSLGGEGVVLHHPWAELANGPTWNAMKVKPRDDAEAVVIGHAEGRGEWSGLCGALVLRADSGMEFNLAACNQELRRSPPAVGEVVSFWHRGFTDAGIPREAAFHRVRGRF